MVKSGRSERLTEAERAVVELVAEGYTNADIAARLYISPNTVKTHIANIFRKLDVHSRQDAGRIYRTLTALPLWIEREFASDTAPDLAEGSGMELDRVLEKLGVRTAAEARRLYFVLKSPVAGDGQSMRRRCPANLARSTREKPCRRSR